jgi:hypothetical protein
LSRVDNPDLFIYPWGNTMIKFSSELLHSICALSQEHRLETSLSDKDRDTLFDILFESLLTIQAFVEGEIIDPTDHATMQICLDEKKMVVRAGAIRMQLRFYGSTRRYASIKIGMRTHLRADYSEWSEVAFLVDHNGFVVEGAWLTGGPGNLKKPTTTCWFDESGKITRVNGQGDPHKAIIMGDSVLPESLLRIVFSPYS